MSALMKPIERWTKEVPEIKSLYERIMKAEYLLMRIKNIGSHRQIKEQIDKYFDSVEADTPIVFEQNMKNYKSLNLDKKTTMKTKNSQEKSF
jgi:uncharacterized protein YkvS